MFTLYIFFFFYRNVDTTSANVTRSLETAAPATTSDTHKTETVRHATVWETKKNSNSDAVSTIVSQAERTVPTNISIPLLRNASLERFVPNYNFNSHSTNL
jgi:hypothetical protein